LILVVQSLLLIVLSLPFGLSIHAVGVVMMLALVALIGLLVASVSYAVALWVKSEDAYAPIVFTAALPLLLLSGVLLPMSLAPGWLRAIAAANPLAYAVDASRAIFNDHLTDVSVTKGVAIIAVLALGAVLLAARSFARAIA
jgi:ABC-2 type transport system permease protein